MNLNIAEELKNVPEAKVEAPKEAVSAESQEATLTAKAEGAEASLQSEIDSMEAMMKDMPDMDAETAAMMQGQIDEMKAELAASKEGAENASEREVDFSTLEGAQLKSVFGEDVSQDIRKAAHEADSRLYMIGKNGMRDMAYVDGQAYVMSRKKNPGEKDEVSKDYSYVRLPDGNIAMKGFEAKDETGVREKYLQTFDAQGRVISSERFVRDDKNGDWSESETMQYDQDGSLIESVRTRKGTNGAADNNLVVIQSRGSDGEYVSKFSGEKAVSNRFDSAEDVQEALRERKGDVSAKSTAGGLRGWDAYV